MIGAVKIAGIAILVFCSVAGLGLRVAILRFIRSQSQLMKRIDPGEAKRKAGPWIVSQLIRAILVVPLMLTAHGTTNAVFAAGVIFWLVLTTILRLVGYLAGRIRGLL